MPSGVGAPGVMRKIGRFQPRPAASWRTTSAALSVRVSTVNLPCWVRVPFGYPSVRAGNRALERSLAGWLQVREQARRQLRGVTVDAGV